MVSKGFSKIWKLRVFLFVIFSLFFACENPAADPADFTAQDLSRQDFSSLRVQRFDLSGKNLQNTTFQFSDVSGTNFTGADLKGASFEGTILDGANFTNADMRGVNLDGACLFQTATWTGAILDPKWEKIVSLFEDGQLITQDLRGYDLSSVCFDHIDWEAPDFSDANLENALFQSFARKLANASFRNAHLQSAALSLADLENADFTGAILVGTHFESANLKGAAIFSEAFSQALINDCTRLPSGSLVSEKECHGSPPATHPPP